LAPPTSATNLVDIAAGYDHVLALTRSGTVIAWGGYHSDGTTDVPPDLAGVVDLAAGFRFSMALKDDGSIVAWGRNDYG
jgi:alpha-tubulin suppressor-like RCC1 family protein